MLTGDVAAKHYPATAPPTPAAKPSAGPAGPSSLVIPKISAMETDVNPILDISGSVEADISPSGQATQESTTSKVVEAPAKDATEKGKQVMEEAEAEVVVAMDKAGASEPSTVLKMQ